MSPLMTRVVLCAMCGLGPVRPSCCPALPHTVTFPPCGPVCAAWSRYRDTHGITRHIQCLGVWIVLTRCERFIICSEWSTWVHHHHIFSYLLTYCQLIISKLYVWRPLNYPCIQTRVCVMIGSPELLSCLDTNIIQMTRD